MITYKAYRIEQIECGPKRWIARIRRTDGQNLRIFVPPSEHRFLDTQPKASEEEAIGVAKQGIDFGGMV